MAKPTVSCFLASNERTPNESGFTILEMLVALGILTTGLTAVLSLFAVGVQTRRGAEAQARAADVAERVFFEIEQKAFAADPENDLLVFDAPLPEPVWTPIEDFTGMAWQVEYSVEPDRPDLVLAKLDIRWAEEGEFVRQIYRRLLVRREPLTARIKRWREASNR